tara:strand:- start:2997 stop:5900 length:2904 start_codon:yes stop_codon:yes gene_type:complete
MADFGKLLLLAGSAMYKKDKEETKLRKEEAKQIALDKAAAAQKVREAEEKERVRRDENAPRLIYKTPNGVWGEHMIGSPRMLPKGAKVVKTGTIKNGWQAYAGESKIENLRNYNGSPVPESQLRNIYGPRYGMTDIDKLHPVVGNVVDGKLMPFESGFIKAMRGPAKINHVDEFYIGGKKVADETEAIKINKETGDPIRHVMKKYENGQLTNQTERDYAEPGKTPGEDYYFITLDNGMIVKSKNQSYFTSKGYDKSDIPTGKFVGDRLVSQSLKPADPSFGIEYEMEDGSTKLSTDPDFTDADRKKAVRETRVEISPDGKSVKALAGSTSRTPKDTAATARALEMSKYSNYMTIGTDTIIGAKDSHSIFEKANSLNGSVIDNLNEINSTEGKAAEFVSKFGPTFKQRLDTDPNLKAARTDLEENGIFLTHKQQMVSAGFANVLQVKGMEQFLLSLDMKGNADMAARIQQTLSTENPSGAVVVVTEGVTNEGETEPFANLIYGKVASEKYAPFIRNTLYPKLLEATNNQQIANDLLSALIADKTDAVGNLVQRPDGHGPVPANNQLPLDGLMSMSTSIIAAGSDTRDPVSELDVFFAMINSTDPATNSVLAAADSDTRERIANKFAKMIDGDLQAGVLTVRGLISVAGVEAQNLMARQYGLDGSAQGKQRRYAFRTQKDSAVRGTRAAKSALGSYFDPRTGRPYGSSAVANFDLTIDGLQYLAREFGERGAQFLSKLSGGAVGADLDTAAESLIDSIIAKGSTDNDINITESARELLVQDAKKVTAQMQAAGNDMEKRVIATRNFHITVLAYELSAAIQGGTGGRTISDQDVQLILSALRQGTFDSPDAQRASLMAAKDMLDSIRIRAKYLSSDDFLDNAAMAIADDMLASSDVVITPASAANKLRSDLGGTGFSAEDKVKDMSDRQIIMMMNRNLPAGEKLKEGDPIDKNSPAYQLMLKSLKKGQSS